MARPPDFPVDAANAPSNPGEATLLRLLVEAARDYAIFVTDPSGTILIWNPGVRTLTGYEESEFVGQNAVILFTPEDRAAGAPEHEMETAMREGVALDERWHLRKDGSRFWGSGFMHALYEVGTDEDATPGRGNLRGFAKILRDQTRAKHRDEELSAKVKEHTEARDRAQRQLLTAQEEERRHISRELHDQTGQHLAGLALELAKIERAAEVIRDAARQATLTASNAAAAAREAATQAEQAASVAAQASPINGDTHHKAARLASEAARTAAIGSTDALAASQAAEAARRVVEEMAPRIALLRETIDSLARDVHRIAVDLRPPSLDDLGLVAALRSYTEACAQRIGATADFESIGLEEGGRPLRLPAEIETALFRIVQEALTNVTKHAAPGITHVGVTLQRVDGNVLVTIEDDGKGFNPDATAAGRLGLSGMRERAAMQGGTLEIESAPGKGTTVYVRLPVPSPPSPR